MLTMFAVAVLAQTAPPLEMQREAIERLVSPSAKKDLAADLLRVSKHAFTPEEVAALKKALSNKTPAPQPPQPCVAPPRCAWSRNDECTNARAFIFDAVATPEVASNFVEEAASALKEKDSTLWFPAQRVLGAAGDARIEAAARTLLGDDEARCRVAATELLSRLPKLSPQTVEQLKARARAPGADRKAIAKLLGQRKEPWARELASAFLRSPDPAVRTGRLEAFSTRAPEAKELEQLRFVAACDPWLSVRSDARALLSDGGTPLPGCPAASWALVDAEVATSGKRSVKLIADTNFSAAERCEGQGVFAGRCVRGEDGRLWWGKSVVVDDPELHPLLLLHWKQDAVLISGSTGLDPDVSGVALLSAAKGGVEFKWLATFEGSIDRYAVDGEQLFFTVRTPWNSPCGNGLDVLYVLERDGRYSIGRSDATECLWNGKKP